MKNFSFVAVFSLACAPGLSLGQAADTNPPASGAGASGASGASDSSTTPDAGPDTGSTDSQPLALGGDEDQFKLRITPYVWMASLSGDIGVNGTRVDATKSFVDIIKDSDLVFGLMGYADLEYNRWVFQFSGAWSLTEVKDSNVAVSDGTADIDVRTNTGWFELFGGYRVFEDSLRLGADADPYANWSLDLFAGGRITTVNTDIDLRAASNITLGDGSVLPANATGDLDSSESWFEPFVGGRVTLNLTEHWAVMFRGDVGGFGVDNTDFSWQAAGALGYWWKAERCDIGVFGGYRALGQDYDSGDFAWDIITHGPMIGAAFTFRF